MGKIINILDNRYGRLVVKGLLIKKNIPPKWLCVCDCGNITILRGTILRKGITKSCGCLQRESVRKHGMRETPLYRVWSGLKNRCYNYRSKDYQNYGGRGVKVCDRWLQSFENFYEDVFNDYKKGLQLDRIDVNGNYEPSNCRWVTIQQNSFNRRPKKASTSKYKGVTKEKKSNKWRAVIKYNSIHYSLGSFDNEKDAALAYNASAKEFFGEYAYINIIE